MLFKSELVGQASGSMGSITASHNRYGMYFRNRSIPVNPCSSRQQAARNAFTDAANYWSSTLTEAERTAWNDYAASVPVLNSLGDSVYLTGFAMFLRSAALWLLQAMTVVEAGPTILTLPEADASFAGAISEATQQISVSFDEGKDWVSEDDAFMSVYMMQPKGLGRDYLVGPSRYAGKIDGDSASPPTSPQTVAVPFTATEGQKVIVLGRIGRADGRLSNLFQDSLSVAS